MAPRRQLGRVRRLVVKVGTGLITRPGLGPDPERIAALAAELASVREGRELVLVTSGAIATGTHSRFRQTQVSRRTPARTRIAWAAG